VALTLAQRIGATFNEEAARRRRTWYKRRRVVAKISAAAYHSGSAGALARMARSEKRQWHQKQPWHHGGIAAARVASNHRVAAHHRIGHGSSISSIRRRRRLATARAPRNVPLLWRACGEQRQQQRAAVLPWRACHSLSALPPAITQAGSLRACLLLRDVSLAA